VRSLLVRMGVCEEAGRAKGGAWQMHS